MEDYNVIRKQYLQIYDFSAVADLAAPKGGQLAIVTHTPDFGTAQIILITDGSKTIRELYNIWKASQLLTSQDLAAMVSAEAQSRQQADATLQQNIDALTLHTEQELERKAPIHSPQFTGIPEVTIPDYTVPLQAVPVSDLLDTLNLIRNLTYGRWRTCEQALHHIRPRYRCFERGDGNFHLTRKFERAII